MEAQRHVSLCTDHLVGPPNILEVGEQLPAEPACEGSAWTLTDAFPTPQVSGQHSQAVHLVAFVIAAQLRSACSGRGCLSSWCWVHCRHTACYCCICIAGITAGAS